MPKPIYYPPSSARLRLGQQLSQYVREPEDDASALMIAYFISTMTRESGITCGVGSSESSAKGLVGMTRPSYRDFMNMQVSTCPHVSAVIKFKSTTRLTSRLFDACQQEPTSFYTVPVYSSEDRSQSKWLLTTRNIICDAFVTLWPLHHISRSTFNTFDASRLADLLAQAYCSHWLGRPVGETLDIWSTAKITALKKYWHTTRFFAQTFERVAKLMVDCGRWSPSQAMVFIDAIAERQRVLARLANRDIDYIASYRGICDHIALGPDGTSSSLPANTVIVPLGDDDRHATTIVSAKQQNGKRRKIGAVHVPSRSYYL